MRSHRLIACVLPLALAGALELHAQCPDGTPPPCRQERAARAARPALNDRAWIVVPFTNATRAPDLEWLRDASVNLLSLEVGRWTDVKVVDDKRVGDLLRELPAARTGQALTLSDGLSLARRAGAGRLVMGDFYRLGTGARVVAQVYDTRSGDKLRAVTQQAPDADSMLAAFGALARGVLAVPPPPDAKLGALGTTRTDAYRAYLQGVTSLNRFDIVTAVKHLERAVELDSAFALAHHKLALALGWSDISDSAQRAHALAAARLAANLPPRERALIAGHAAHVVDDYTRACSILRPLVARDSSDVEALYQLGECLFHEEAVDPLPGDSTRGQFRGSYNEAIAAFRRVLQLDPANHLAFTHILDALGYARRTGCVLPPGTTTCASRNWTAYLYRDGDSLVTAAWRNNPREVARQLALRESSKSRIASLRVALQIAQEWVNAAPTVERAHYYLGKTYLLLGQPARALPELLAVRSGLDPRTRQNALLDRIDAGLKLGDAAAARAALDSLERESAGREGSPGRQRQLQFEIASAEALFGRLDRFRRWTTEGGPRGWNPLGVRYYALTPLALLGIPNDSLLAEERALFEALGQPGVCPTYACRLAHVQPSVIYGWRWDRRVMPPLDSAPRQLVYLAPRARQLGHADSVRSWATWLDSVAYARARSAAYDEGAHVSAIDAYLAVPDSASALRLARAFVDSQMVYIPMFPTGFPMPNPGPLPAALWPRVMLQRADLAAALGSPDEARVWYRRVLDLWAEADPAVQPTVARIRAALARLGG